MPDLLAWLIHPLRSWDALQDRLIARDDQTATQNGWTVEVLPGGRRRYRDPRLDALRAPDVSTIARPFAEPIAAPILTRELHVVVTTVRVEVHGHWPLGP